MSLITTLVLLLATTSITLTRSQETEISSKGLETTQAPIKLDKNLRRALLKALSDLEAESAEQHREELDNIAQRDTSNFEGVAQKNLNTNLGIQKTSYSFKSFPGDDDTPSEDKLQNSSFVDAVRYVTLKTPAMNIEKASQDDARSFHVQNVILPEKSSSYGVKAESKLVQQESRNAQPLVNTFSVSKVESLTLKPASEVSESLAGSATNGIATANAVISPKPTQTTPTNSNATSSSDSKDKTEEVKIFQAPLVAAFTVQQDEQGVPKSVVPIFRSPNDGHALTLQEQLEFKQRLLEKQLAELQQQQVQQTQFLVRQQHLYEQQLRHKQQQQYYLQEQARIKQFEEQARIKQFEEQARIKQFDEQARLKRLEEQRIKQLEEQRLHQFQRPVPQKQFFSEQSNNFLSFQPSIEPNVHLQPSVTLEVPSVAAPPPFQPSFQEQFRSPQFRPQLSQLQTTQPQPQQQQRLQQSFSSFSSEFQPSHSSTRFHRQEAFNAVGNFGFNVDNKPTPVRSNFGFNVPQRSPTNYYNPYTQYRQSKPPTPAKQIQNLLYQSGIAGDINNVQGIGNPEDLNIVSKVLALNVGAVPNKNLQHSNPATFGRVSA